MMSGYCHSLTRTIRRSTREVMVGHVGVGGAHPIRIQSMTTSDTKDIAATVAQSVALAEAGCEIVRITAPNATAARCLGDIRRELDRRKIHVPLVADIHFLPAAAMEAVEHVEKIRINPGNYADRKKFAIREYSDSQYDEELERLHQAFSPLVLRCKELGRSMRIGTNHGSLSDRIMNRYGDTPLGMVESALEFLHIAESHSYRDIILSMKASNPKVMIQTYRLLVARMNEEGMNYPLHLGVTEAGDGEDGRIKSAIGIGSLLADGLGDTIRVSLTEDSVYEIPVARALADKIQTQWDVADPAETQTPSPSVGGTNGRGFTQSPYEFTRRSIAPIVLGGDTVIATNEPPRVFVRLTEAEWQSPDLAFRLARAALETKENPIEGILLSIASRAQFERAISRFVPLAGRFKAVALELSDEVRLDQVSPVKLPPVPFTWILLRRFVIGEAEALDRFLTWAHQRRAIAAVDVVADALPSLAAPIREAAQQGIPLIFTMSRTGGRGHAVGQYRRLTEFLNQEKIAAPIWIRNTRANSLQEGPEFLSRLLEASIATGSLLCDGVGDMVSIETEEDFVRAAKLGYNVLQGARARISKTEFVACPSCGRTLFDLQSTTQRIRQQTGHLKGVTIAIMGCIVNGPGEMADADFGYVGGAPGRVNLYVGKECIRYHVPAEEADQKLIELIKEHGKWTEPEPAEIAF
jgi:(E)-4-hydroxy-3-methylbut-2-enyl-diphosphate synthase